MRNASSSSFRLSLAQRRCSPRLSSSRPAALVFSRRSSQAADGTNYDIYPNIFFRLLNQVQFVAGLCGEDSHNHHHTHGGLAHRPGVDLPFHVFVRPLRALGLIWNVEVKGR
jgi:hypothetical protein